LTRGKLTVAQQIQWTGKPLKPQITRLKTDESYRTITLYPDVAAGLKRLRLSGLPRPFAGHLLVFPSTTGTPLNPNNLLRSFYGTLKRAWGRAVA
jgi:hypothetical protein